MLQRNSQMRGQLVAKLPDLVQKMYGFDDEKSARAMEENRELFALLKADNGFYFKVQLIDTSKNKLTFHQVPAMRQGLYKHGIIQAAINKMWFAGPSAEGIKFKAYFDPISLKNLSLVLTAVSRILDQYLLTEKSNRSSLSSIAGLLVFTIPIHNFTRKYTVLYTNDI